MATLTLPELAEAYEDNPHEVAGFADVAAINNEGVRQIMLLIKGWARAEGVMRPEHSAKLLFGLLHVARDSYAAWGTGDYWPHLEGAMQCKLSSAERARVRGMFRDALNAFGYPSVGRGDCLVRDASYHCGVPDQSLAGLVEYAADIVDE